MASSQVDSDAKKIYNYHRLSLSQPPLSPSSAIFCLCSLDVRVATHAATLFLSGMAPLLIFSGGSGKLTEGRFNESEADTFASIAVKMGVPREKILVENQSTNTGENVRFTHALLQERGVKLDSVILVQKPYMERRTYATFAKQWPGIETSPIVFQTTSPRIEFEDYFNEDNPRELIYNVMVGDLVRLKVYAERGFQVEMDVDGDVWEAGRRMIQAGYDRHLP